VLLLLASLLTNRRSADGGEVALLLAVAAGFPVSWALSLLVIFATEVAILDKDLSNVES